MGQGATALKVRGGFLVGALLLLLALMAGRFFQLMVLRHDELRVRAISQLTRREEVKAYRGRILDRHGRELALTRLVPSVAVDPGGIAPSDRDGLASALAGPLGLAREKVLAELGKPCRFRWLRRRVLDDVAIRAVRAIDHPAIIIREELCRTHPAGAVGAHLVGMTNSEGAGIAGAEQSFDGTLAPKFGERVVMRDAWAGRRIAPHDGMVREGRDGEDVVLSMDLAIQTFAEEALDRACAKWQPKAAVVVVLDPRTGDILAAASRPGFDPDERRGLTKDAIRFGVISDPYEVGSTMKPLIAAGAFDAGLVHESSVIDCTTSGAARIRGRLLHDHKPLGRRTFAEVIVYSSNIGMARVVEHFENEAFFRHVRALGFGAPTGCGLPCEGRGVIRRATRKDYATKEKRDRHDRIWGIPSIAMGHDILVTPLQFATAFAALANGGVLNRPRIALSVGGREVPAQPLRQVVSERTSRDVMVPILVRVVDEGTGRNARVPGYRVGGKTGTAVVKDRKGNVLGYTSSFAGFAPAEKPRFLVFALMSRPRRDLGVTPYGGSTAGPVVGEVLARCLRYAEIAPTVTTPPVPRRIDERPSRVTTRGAPRASTPTTRRSARDIDLLQKRLREGGSR
ncbi:MAG: penicillin-binding protein 2 [Planctomycetota bacterium]